MKLENRNQQGKRILKIILAQAQGTLEWSLGNTWGHSSDLISLFLFPMFQGCSSIPLSSQGTLNTFKLLF